MEAEELKSEADASQGTSKHQRVKQKRASRTQSHGNLGGSESHLVKCKRIKKKRASRLPRAIDAPQQQPKGCCNCINDMRTRVTSPSLVAIVERLRLQLAEIALKYYATSQDAEFEILEVMDDSDSTLCHPESKPECSKLWVHISFIAKPKNSDSSPKYFFGELYEDDLSGQYHATYCSTFEPSNDPGFHHGCIFCPPGQKFHPACGYLVGRPPWYIQKFVFA